MYSRIEFETFHKLSAKLYRCKGTNIFLYRKSMKKLIFLGVLVAWSLGSCNSQSDHGHEGHDHATRYMESPIPNHNMDTL